jgi:hypothetical protein
VNFLRGPDTVWSGSRLVIEGGVVDMVLSLKW